MDNICPQCHKEQFSLMDKKYLEQNGQCWSCDRQDWQRGELPPQRKTRQRQRREGGR